jgi:hypothetical protein
MGFLGHNRGKAMIKVSQLIDFAGGPGGTRTPNQAVMSGGRNQQITDLCGVCYHPKADKSRFVPLFLGQTGART